jgi:prevent-host-death family protein
MKTLGIRQAKAHLSQLVRAASTGERSLVTDNRKPVAMIGPPPVAIDEGDAPHPGESLSDAAQFRLALLNAPYPLDLDF